MRKWIGKLISGIALLSFLTGPAFPQANLLYPPRTALTSSSTAALATNLVAKPNPTSVTTSQPGYMWSFEVSADSTLSGAAWWILIYDAATAPADGAVVPRKCYAQASGTTQFSKDFNEAINFINGMIVAVSTTGCFTQTSSTHAFIAVDYQ